MRALLALLLLSACGQDVVLGHLASLSADAADDPGDAATQRFDAVAGPDAATNRFWPGLYELTYGPERDTMCDGALTGTEAAYASITAESLSFTGGDVTLVHLGPSTIRLDGAVLEPPFGTAALVLQSGFEEAPELFGAQRARTVTPGPEGTTTQLTAVAIQLDSATATGRTAEGVVVSAYESTDRSSACLVAFAAHLVAVGL